MIERFQHTAARRRLQTNPLFYATIFCFNTQPREGGCPPPLPGLPLAPLVSTHSRAKAAAAGVNVIDYRGIVVSTHSRAKAAADKHR